MTTWRAIAGNATSITFFDNSTRLTPPWGTLLRIATEANAQMRMRVDGGHVYTWANLFVRVTSNNVDNPSSCVTRINGANGNLSVSFAADESGVKEDTVNTDSLVDGDLVNMSFTAGNGAHGDQIVLSIIGTTMDDSAASPQSFAGTDVDSGTDVPNSTTRLFTISGGATGASTADELRARYTVQVASTAEKLRLHLSANNVNGASTFDFQINQVDTALDLSIPGETSGEFEDTTDTAAVSVGDEIRYNLVTGGTMSLLTLRLTGVRMDAARRHLASHNSGATSAIQRPFGITCFGCLEEGGEGGGVGDTPFWNTTESAAQITARIAMEVENLFVRISLNDLNGATTVALRVNGSNSALSVSIGSSATGTFEDTVDTIDIVDTDTVNYILDTSTPTSGNITLVACGVATGQAVVVEGPEVIHSRSLEAFSRP